MAERRPLVLVAGVLAELPPGDSLPGGGASVPDVLAPSNITPAAGATDVGEMPYFVSGPYYELYGAPQAAQQVQISSAADFATLVHDSGEQPAGAYALAPGILSVATLYYWRVRYKSARGMYGTWSAPTGFTTAASFSIYITTPAATPAAFGAAFEGGYYAGMVWNELVQSSTSTAIGTGSKTFTVPSMTGAPIVYGGQLLEIRSRANPASKMVGTVTGAAGTQLTVNITSVGGSGTFTDWSIMSRYRIIAAPKASGENASVLLKNVASAMPTACQTASEGWQATNAMRDADTSTVYPAAHWARGLSIGGRADWYIPARDELELLWRNLKPITTGNDTSSRPDTASFSYANRGSLGDLNPTTCGHNLNSTPQGAVYTAGVPAQTAAAAFQTGGAEAMYADWYWTASEYGTGHQWQQHFGASSGTQDRAYKDGSKRIRAVRRSII